MIRILDGTILCDTQAECVIIKNAIAFYAFRPNLWQPVGIDDEIQWKLYSKPIHTGDEDYLFWFVWMTEKFWELVRLKLHRDLEYLKEYASLELEFSLSDECGPIDD